ncbi:unnamed protein product [Arctia plantaginis]|uniref:Uncharacterized protein n=1 Tax=Arctia plantaginis TaxID=874455 RepID=A0A8S0Z6G3_ARCPL|nr:unnamed protein product [Arctia plantaginis]
MYLFLCLGNLIITQTFGPTRDISTAVAYHSTTDAASLHNILVNPMCNGFQMSVKKSIVAACSINWVGENLAHTQGKEKLVQRKINETGKLKPAPYLDFAIYFGIINWEGVLKQ